MEIAPYLLEAHILIVDDESANVRLLERILQRHGYLNVVGLTDARAVARLCQETHFDAFLLDIRMPYLDGFEILAHLKERYAEEYLPVVVLTAQTDRETRLKALELGAKDFLTKPFDQLEALARIRNILEAGLMHRQVRNQNQRLEQQVRLRTQELYDTRQEVIRRLGLAAEYRDNETGNHTIRMSQFARLLASAYGLPAEHAELIHHAAPMHDVGKIGIPDAILLKPGKLDADEWRVMQSHVEIGAQILSGSSSTLIETARLIALQHHEKWDGGGYPQGLQGEEISIEGRICALADVFDALTSERPYKRAWSVEDAVAFIDAQAGLHFEPRLVYLLGQVLPEMRIIMDEYSD